MCASKIILDWYGQLFIWWPKLWRRVQTKNTWRKTQMLKIRVTRIS